MSAPKIGEMVHVVLDGGPRSGEHRPAVVTRVVDEAKGVVALTVFTDGAEDGDVYYAGAYHIARAVPDETDAPAPHTYHLLDESTGVVPAEESTPVPAKGARTR